VTAGGSASRAAASASTIGSGVLAARCALDVRGATPSVPGGLVPVPDRPAEDARKRFGDLIKAEGRRPRHEVDPAGMAVDRIRERGRDDRGDVASHTLSSPRVGRSTSRMPKRR